LLADNCRLAPTTPELDSADKHSGISYEA
jgi:hypothetical protein